MPRGRFAEEQIIGVLREHEAGANVMDLFRKHGISGGAYTWKSKYGGMTVSEAARLRASRTRTDGSRSSWQSRCPTVSLR